MRKGDTVQLKESVHILSTILTSSADRIEVKRLATEGKISLQLTVSKSGRITLCCVPHETIQFEEIPGTFFASSFEVVLPSGEPDVESLMKEAAEKQFAILF